MVPFYTTACKPFAIGVRAKITLIGQSSLGSVVFGIHGHVRGPVASWRGYAKFGIATYAVATMSGGLTLFKEVVTQWAHLRLALVAMAAFVDALVAGKTTSWNHVGTPLFCFRSRPSPGNRRIVKRIGIVMQSFPKSAIAIDLQIWSPCGPWRSAPSA